MDPAYYRDEPSNYPQEAVVVDVAAAELRADDVILQAGSKPLLVVDVMSVPAAELVSVQCHVDDGVSVYRIWPSSTLLHVARWEVPADA